MECQRPLDGRFDCEKLWAGLGESKDSNPSGIFDWVGDFYSYGSFPRLPAIGWQSPATPQTQGDGFRAGPIEWAAFALAAQLCIRDLSQPTLIEAGASQGLWCLPWIRCLNRSSRGLDNILAIAFEASPSLTPTESFWNNQQLDILRRTKTSDRLTLEGERWRFEWIQHALSHFDGTAYFPDVDCQSDNGSSMSTGGAKSALARLVRPATWLRTLLSWVRRKPTPANIAVQVDNIATVLTRYRQVGLLHMDLQGEELAIVENRAIDAIAQQVSVLMLGTHSHAVESTARERLPSLGFTLLLQSSAVFHRGTLCNDGEQLWISNTALAAARKVGLILE